MVFLAHMDESNASTLLSETWEQNNTLEWRCDYVQGESVISTTQPHSGTYSFRMPSDYAGVNPGNYVLGFGYHPECNPSGTMVSEVVLEEWIYLDVGYAIPTDGMKIWIINSFESWEANYSTADGESKPHAWAPYYFFINLDSSRIPRGINVRADNLGGTNTGELWVEYPQNQGIPVEVPVAIWTKIKIRLKLNILNQSDGIYQLWINDTLKASYTNMNFRANLTSYGWNHLMLSNSTNGLATRSQYTYRDDLIIDDTYASVNTVSSGSGVIMSGVILR